MYSERVWLCLGCGQPLVKRAPNYAKVRCINCAVERSVENILQLRAKRGAFYDKWAAGIARAAGLELERSRANKAAEKRG